MVSILGVKQKKKFSSPIGHSGAHCCKLRTTFGFSRRDNCNKVYTQKCSRNTTNKSIAAELRDENEMNDYFLGGKQGRMTTTCSGWEKFLSKRPARLQFFQFRQIPWGCVVSSLPLLLRYLIVLSVCMCHYVLAAAIWNSCEIFQLIWMSMSMHETADDGAVPTRKYPETIVWNNKERIHFSKRISWEN